MPWIIVKYYDDNQTYTRDDHCGNTHTGRACGCSKEPIIEKHVANIMLKKMIEYNPSVYYGMTYINETSESMLTRLSKVLTISKCDDFFIILDRSEHRTICRLTPSELVELGNEIIQLANDAMIGRNT